MTDPDFRKIEVTRASEGVDPRALPIPDLCQGAVNP
jgi:hypothetical protein